jgi:hypothetical protein
MWTDLEEEPHMPNYDLGILITLNLLLTLIGITLAVVGIWAIVRVVQRVGTMTQEVAFMIRRQYGDIDRDLQEIKELLGGQ